MSDYAGMIGDLSTKAIGMDVSDKWSRIFVVHEKGEEEELRIRTTPEDVEAFFSEYEGVRVILEAGTHSPWISEMLEELGHEVIVTDPGETALISKGKKKSDREDAKKLAYLGVVNPSLLSPIRHRGREARLDLSKVRLRSLLVQMRTQAMLHVRGVVKSFGLRVKSHSPEVFPRKVREELAGEAILAAVEPALKTMEGLTEEIRKLDRWLEEAAPKKYPEVELLRQVDGVGPVVSLTYVLTLEDPHRFRRSRDVGAYVGLVPRLHESGEQEGPRRLSKAGDEELRRVLIQAAHHVLGRWGKDSRLRRWGLALMERKGRKKAVAAVARKLAVILHRIWVTGAEWDPEHGIRARKAVPAEAK